MDKAIDVILFFNFRSPYCFLASKTMWPILDDYKVNLIWKPVAGWELRSSPQRAKSKMPLARQDLTRYARRLKLKIKPPPVETEPTIAALGSLLAEEKSLLRPYIIEVMHAEWSEGENIGKPEVLFAVAEKIGLNREQLEASFSNKHYLEKLKTHAKEAEEIGAIGVPTFVIGDEIFWGQDRIDFVLEELQMLSRD